MGCASYPSKEIKASKGEQNRPNIEKNQEEKSLPFPGSELYTNEEKIHIQKLIAENADYKCIFRLLFYKEYININKQNIIQKEIITVKINKTELENNNEIFTFKTPTIMDGDAELISIYKINNKEKIPIKGQLNKGDIYNAIWY